MLKDGLKLRDIHVESVERKVSTVEGRVGLVIAKMKSTNDLMKNKAKLIDSKNADHKKVFIE